jgi:hypothetical protein
LQTGDHADDPAAFAARIKTLLGRGKFATTSIYDDRRFHRSVEHTCALSRR